MTDAPRSNRPEVRNPVLALPSARKIANLPVEAREILADLLGEISRVEALAAQNSWQRRKGPMAVYHRANSVWARHLRVAVRATLRNEPAKACGAEQRSLL